jgi:hypothetical protein
MMQQLWRALNALLRPYVRTWWLYCKIGWETIPRPFDEPVVTVLLDDMKADRVLLIGDGPAMGFGVTSHSLALPGQLARQLAKATGRWASVQLISDLGLDIHTAVAQFHTAGSPSADVAIVLLGTTDIARLTSVRVWRRELHRLIQTVNKANDRSAEVILVAVPPVSRMPILTGLVAFLSGRHAHILNRESRSVAAGYPNVTFLPFVPKAEPDHNRYRSGSTYRAWAEQITPLVADSLDRVAIARDLEDEGLRRPFLRTGTMAAR